MFISTFTEENVCLDHKNWEIFWNLEIFLTHIKKAQITIPKDLQTTFIWQQELCQWWGNDHDKILEILFFKDFSWKSAVTVFFRCNRYFLQLAFFHSFIHQKSVSWLTLSVAGQVFFPAQKNNFNYFSPFSSHMLSQRR